MCTDTLPRKTNPLAKLLLQRFQPSKASGVELRIALETTNSETLLLDIRDERLKLSVPLKKQADVTLYFDSVDTAIDIFQGTAHPIDAFMAHKFRSDGNLVMVFTLLAMFGPGATSP